MGKSIKSKLTPKQEMFCQELVKTGNQAQSYRVAYNTENMKDNTIHRKANELMKNGNVTARIKELRVRVLEKTEITIEKMVKMLFAIAAESGKDRVQAIDKIMKHLGGYEIDNKQKVVDEKIDYSKLNANELKTLLKLQLKARS